MATIATGTYTPLPEATFTVLNLGAGRQSVALLALACAGLIPKPDLVIHADTGHERKSTYRYIDQVIIPKCEEAGIHLEIVGNGNIREDTLRSTREGTRIANAPYFVDKGDGKRGKLRRACTSEYKIVPIEREIRRVLGIAKGCRVKTKAHPHHVEQWIGIATEESQRESKSARVWSTLTFPLLQLGLSTSDCIQIIKDLGWAVPAKSACIACPFRSDSSWARLKNQDPDAWADAVDFDEKLRWPHGKGRINWGVSGGEQFPVEPSKLKGSLFPAFVHSSCKPLGEIDFKDDGSGEDFGGSYC